MAIYHLSVKIISRGKGRSAVAAAAYRSGTKLYNQYDGVLHDYTHKQGVVDSTILLPPHAPREYLDRETLWNAVEKIEKAKNSQLAREIELAIPKELPLSERKRVVLNYVQDTFVAKGMIADVCFHDKIYLADNKIVENPHAHILLTMRPLHEDGTWGNKQRKEYVLDENGERIYDKKKRQYKCRTVPTTDWNERSKVEEWRSQWETYANAALKDCGQKEQIDARSYERQGIKRLPTIHMGVASSAMERRGIQSERGNYNRSIQRSNAILKECDHKISELKRQIQEIITEAKERIQRLSEMLARLFSRFLLAEYQSIQLDVDRERIKRNSTGYDLKKALRCYDLEQRYNAETDKYRRYELQEELVQAYCDADIMPGETYKIIKQLQEEQNRLQAVGSTKEKIGQDMETIQKDYLQWLYEALGEEDVQEVLEIEQSTRAENIRQTKETLMQVYGKEYHEGIFEEAVKCAEEDVNYGGCDRNREQIIREVLGFPEHTEEDELQIPERTERSR
ncbi:MAG: MobA/MobL family protein [Lachnospiraceae bacterium]|nr:MobA/MobL family protein [Lachnospiraceae bacterium]